MGLLDTVMGMLGRRKKSGNPLLDALLPMLVGGGALGGLGGLLGKFTGAGLGHKAQSWVSTGPNQPVEAAEVEQALGSGTIGELAAKTGMSNAQVSSGLAGMLPGLVDKLTPGGSVPDAGGLAKVMKGLDLGSLGKMLGG